MEMPPWVTDSGVTYAGGRDGIARLAQPQLEVDVVPDLPPRGRTHRVRAQLPGVGHRGDEPSRRAGCVPVVIVAEEVVRARRPRTTQRRVKQPGGLLVAMGDSVKRAWETEASHSVAEPAPDVHLRVIWPDRESGKPATALLRRSPRGSS